MGLNHIKAIFFRKDLSIGEKWTLTIIGLHCNNEDVCWPTVQLIADEAAMEVHNLRKILRRLEEKKLIERFTDTRGKRSIRYLIPTTPSIGSYVPPEKVASTPPYKEVERKERKGKDNPTLTPSDSEVEKVANSKNPYAGKSLEEIKNSETAKHVLGSLKNVNATELGFIWAIVQAEVYPGRFIPALTGDEKNLLAQFIKKVTVDHAEAGIYYAVKDWIGFVDYCHQCGVKKGPTFPNLLYLVKYSTEAVNFAFSSHAEPKPSGKVKEAVKAAETVTEVSKLKAPKTSIEDFDKIMGES